MKPQEFKPLQTQRLDLKPPVATFDFANKVFDIIIKNTDFFKYMPWTNIKNPEQEFDWLRSVENSWKDKSNATYGMYLRENGDFVGVCTMFAINWENETSEIGYWLNPKYARQGFMSEAVHAVEQYFSGMGFKRIVIVANIENIASCKTAEKCGFEREGIMKAWVYNKILNTRENMALYAKINTK